MSETFWIALLTGAFTLASGVIGVMLTHRYSRTQAEAARREDRGRDARTLLAQFVEAGTQWASMNEAVLPAYYKGASDQTFWMEWPETDSGKAIREHALAIVRTAGELRLIVRDDVLLERIAAAQASVADSGPMSALLAEGRRTKGGMWEGDVMADAFAYHRRVHAAFKSVEERAAELLRGAI
ncbi:hypothetical protein [Microbacterium proteolyticum]|uniref:hypothetical protein n=1 Tax=Microbacterium proteolyticum TaxID=1572644 RepID=UPI001FADA1E4|nr:hypothetical protein [Microbacterium proteolyticum]MCI9856779.1 hypothetical protein [Microbacterium proteolyticum]